MNKLRSLYSTDPSSREVVLQFEQITDLVPLLPLLQRFLRLEKLSVHGNRLRQLPRDLSALQHLKELDITNNMFISNEGVEDALTSLPNLKILTVNTRSRQDEDRIARKLPRLQLLNGQLIRRQVQMTMHSKQAVNTLSQEDLETVAGIFDQVRELFRVSEHDLDKQLATQFDQNVENVIHDLTRRLSHEAAPSHIVQGRIQCAKYALLDLCYVRAIDFVQYTNPTVGKLLVKIHDLHADVFKEIASLVMSKESEQKPREQLPSEKKRWIQEVAFLKKQRASLYEQINQLQLQSNKYLGILASFGLKQSYMPSVDRRSRSPVRSLISASGRSPLKSTSKLIPARSQKQLVSSESFKNLKHMTLGQTIQLMHEIIESKMKQEYKDDSHHSQHQTLEQHMYGFFTKKYGLKNLTVQWAMSLVHAIKMYSDNATVSLFGRILRNEVEESFWIQQQEMIGTIDELLRLVLKEKSNKLDHEIQQVLFKRKSGVLSLSECDSVLASLFSSEDASIIMDHLLKQASNQQKPTRDSTPKKGKMVKYQTFVQLVLEHNLYICQRKNEVFLKQFKKVDTNSDGMISDTECRTLLTKLIGRDKIEMQRVFKSMGGGLGHDISFSAACTRYHHLKKK